MDHDGKLDKGKLDYSLLPPLALEELTKVMMMGKDKYGRNTWQKLPDWRNRYFAALQRHLWAWKKGEEIDPESGLSHLSHVLTNAAFMSELERKEKESEEKEINKDQLMKLGSIIFPSQ